MPLMCRSVEEGERGINPQVLRSVLQLGDLRQRPKLWPDVGCVKNRTFLLWRGNETVRVDMSEE